MGTKSFTNRGIKNDDRGDNEIISCACGCESKLEKYIFYYNKYTDNWQRKERRFVHGHNGKFLKRDRIYRDKISRSMKEWHGLVGHSKETIEKIRQTLLRKRDQISKRQTGKNNSMYGKTHTNRYKKILSIKMRKEGSPSWKGDEVSRKALHQWIKKNKPKSKVCEICKKEKILELSSKKHTYLRNINEWQWVCRKCHREYDPKNMGYLKRKRRNGRFI